MSVPGEARRPVTGDVFVLTMFAALVTGYTEAAVLLVRREVLGDFIRRGPDFAWQSPLAYVLLFAVPGLILAALAHWSPRLMPLHRVVFLLLLAFFTSIAVLLAYQRVHVAALLILPAGAAAQAARLLRPRLHGLVQLSRRAVPVLGGLLILTTAGQPAWRGFQERRAIAGLPAAAPDAPNVLLLILDTVRASSLSLHGFPLATSPNLERWARRGVVFERAIAAAPWTLPSHASLFTGLPPAALAANWTVPLGPTPATLAERLRAGGWATGGVVANQIFATAEHGLGRGFIRYDDYPPSVGLLLRAATPIREVLDSYRVASWVGTDWSVQRRTAGDVNRSFLHWFESLPPGRPFFAFLNYFDAHDPYLPEARDVRELTGREPTGSLSAFRRVSLFERQKAIGAEAIAREKERYEASIRGLDREVGALLDSLDRLGVLRNTVLVITSDHGEEFGEHGAFFHGHTLNAQALHVPLVVIYPPAVPEGIHVSEVASLVDVPATIVQLAAPGAPRFQGRSLSRFWSDTAIVSDTAFSSVRRGIRLPEWYPAATGDLTSVMLGDLHLIRRSDGREELYRWFADPLEANNLISDPASSESVPLLRRLLDQHHDIANRR